MGRPTSFSAEIADRICQGIADGKSLHRVLETSSDFPTHTTVMNWLSAGDAGDERYKAFFDNLMRAREMRQDKILEECLPIADGIMPVTSENDEDDAASFLQPDPQRDRLRVETRLKVLAMMNPKKYGTRVTNEHTGSIKTEAKPDLSSLTDDDLAILASIAARTAPAAGEPEGD